MEQIGLILSLVLPSFDLLVVSDSIRVCLDSFTICMTKKIQLSLIPYRYYSLRHVHLLSFRDNKGQLKRHLDFDKIYYFIKIYLDNTFLYFELFQRYRFLTYDGTTVPFVDLIFHRK